MLRHAPWRMDKQPLNRFLFAAESHTEIELIRHLRPLRHAWYSLDTEFTVARNAVDTVIWRGEGHLKRLAKFCYGLLGTRFSQRQGGYQITRCHRLSVGRALDQERPHGLDHRTTLLRRKRPLLRALPAREPRLWHWLRCDALKQRYQQIPGCDSAWLGTGAILRRLPHHVEKTHGNSLGSGQEIRRLDLPMPAPASEHVLVRLQHPRLGPKA